MKIAAIVILYHPEADFFIRNLEGYADQVGAVLVWKNSRIDFKIPEALEAKVVHCGEGENDFIAKPLNYALNWCVEHGYDYLLTMDQDSTWGSFESFLAKVVSLPKEDVAIFAPNINAPETSKEVLDVESVVTSCSLCNVGIAKRLGGFREDYRIYWVDSEYCCWARKNGYRIQVLAGHPVKHRFGASSKGAFGVKASNYSAAVYYFMFRNMLWMRREYHDNPSVKTILHTCAYYIPGIVFGEKDKLRKLCSIFKAFLHGRFKSIPSKRTNDI